jgi:protein-disulfide isomerase
LGVLSLVFLGIPKTAKLLAGIGGVMAVGVLATAQLIAEPKPTYEIETIPALQGEPDLMTAPGEVGEGEGGGEPLMFEAPMFEAPLMDPGDDGEEEAGQTPDDSRTSETPNNEESAAAISWQLVRRPAAVFSCLSTAMLFAPQEPQPSDSNEKSPEPSGEPSDQNQESAASADASESADENVSEPEERIANFGNSFRLKVASWPLVGDPDASQVIVEMFDYTCPYCRANHRWVREAQANNSNLAVISLPVPMNRDCNDTVPTTDPAHRDACQIAELSVAVWLANREKYPEYHEWLFSGNSAPTAAAAQQQAAQLVGGDELKKALASGTPRAYVQKQVELYRKLGAGKVPKLLFSRTILTGDVGSVRRIEEILRQEQQVRN